MSLMINGSLILMKANLTLQKLLYLLNNQIYSTRFLSNSLATSIKLAVICIGKPTIIQGPLICLIIYITSILSHFILHFRRSRTKSGPILHEACVRTTIQHVEATTPL